MAGNWRYHAKGFMKEIINRVQGSNIKDPIYTGQAFNGNRCKKITRTGIGRIISYSMP
jgi:hypothetical protein